MGSKTGKLDKIHFGNKANFDIYRTNLVEKNIFERTVCPYPAHPLFELVRMYHTYSNVRDPSWSANSATCGSKKKTRQTALLRSFS
jgi:hypothetical protein